MSQHRVVEQRAPRVVEPRVVEQRALASVVETTTDLAGCGLDDALRSFLAPGCSTTRIGVAR